MTTVLFLLRSVEIGISVGDLDLLTIGMVIDMWTEKANDDVKYQRVAGQSEFDRFQKQVFSSIIRVTIHMEVAYI